MPTAKAGELLRLYSLRLKMNDKGLTVWTPALRAAVEGLIEKLKSVGLGEAIECDACANREPIFRFVQVSTGELLGEIPNRRRTQP